MDKNFKDRVKLMLEVKNSSYQWNEYLSSRIDDAKKVEKKETYLDKLDELIAEARKNGAASITGLLIARDLYQKYHK